MSVHGEDEELELSEDLDLKRSSQAEQERGLLEGRKEHDQDEAEDEELGWVSCSRHTPWSWRAWYSIAAASVLALIITLGFVLGLSHESEQRTEDDLERGVQVNDYILSPTWNYKAAPQRREYHWTVRDQEHNPDGVFRPMMLVNNQFPGPLIEINEGDTIVVHVGNQAVNATSIHWHGLYQNGTPHMDGTVGITQCPIAPGGKFTYEFLVSGQSGTYWWHGHNGLQGSDGLHGPLIVHTRDEKQKQEIAYDTDRVVLLSDHYHDLSSALLWQYLAPDAENEEPVPDSGLINGRNIVDCEKYAERKCDNSSIHVGLPHFDLKPNQSHRLRFINVGAFAEFQVQIDEHEFTVTEVDGTDVHPINYHRLNINPAQRYSVVINTTVTTEEKFWLRARMNTFCFKEQNRKLNPDIMAIVRYSETNEEPTSVDWEGKLNEECKDLDTKELEPVDVVPAPEADAYFYLHTNFEIGAWRLSRGVFNSSSWRSNARSPSLLRSIDGITEGNASFTATSGSDAGNGNVFVNDAAFAKDRELVVQATGIQVIDLLFSNFDDGNHPLHLHGYKYFVLAQGHGYPPKKSVFEELTRDNVQPLYDSLDLSNPLRRDTASVEGYGWMLIRILADNPGIWALHCHVSWHSEAGLLMQFLTRSDKLADLALPESHKALCAAEGVELGMGPGDEDYRDFAK
jgi:FtsP/CotA-like multicopper oxidase with cupredoxin domain